MPEAHEASISKGYIQMKGKWQMTFLRRTGVKFFLMFEVSMISEMMTSLVRYVGAKQAVNCEF